MASESKLPVFIFAVLVALIAIPFIVGSFRERSRPIPVEARIVVATEQDPIFRDEPRTLQPGEEARVAVAIRVSKSRLSDYWIAPVSQLHIGGQPVDHLESDRWPDEDRVLRVFWFSIECSTIGGRLTSDKAASLLRYRTFLAPEMGRGLLAGQLPETHNDDHLGEDLEQTASDAGTFRIYARVELVEQEKDVQPFYTVSTQGAEAILEPGFPAIHRLIDLGPAIDPAVGEFFRLPGFEPETEPSDAWNDVTIDAFGRRFTDLADSRIATSSRVTAAVAVSGSTTFDPGTIPVVGELTVADEQLLLGGRRANWGSDVHEGDVLQSGDRWIILLGDEGNGILDFNDAVLHCWGRSPRRSTLRMALPSDAVVVTVSRHEP